MSNKAEWLDISSAPKDGTRILLYTSDVRFKTRPAIGFWGNGLWVAESHENEYLTESENGTLRAFEDYIPRTVWVPTHWMPIPDVAEIMRSPDNH